MVTFKLIVMNISAKNEHFYKKLFFAFNHFLGGVFYLFFGAKIQIFFKTHDFVLFLI